MFIICSSLTEPTLCSFQVNRVKSCNRFRDSRRPANASVVHCSHTEYVGPSLVKTSHRILADFYRSIIALDPVFQAYFTSWSSRRQLLSVSSHNKNTPSYIFCDESASQKPPSLSWRTKLCHSSMKHSLYTLSSDQTTNSHLVRIYS